MRFDWIQSAAAQQIFKQMADRRPAWLWSADGETLILRNPAARLFKAKIKKDRLKPAKDAVPIKGQVRRLMRLGSVGLSSPARVQFLVGQKPVSATCICTPLLLDNSEAALLIVNIDPIKHWSRRALDMPDPHFSSLLSNNVAHVFYDKKGHIVVTSEAVSGAGAKKKFSGGKKWVSVAKASKHMPGFAVRVEEKEAEKPVSDREENSRGKSKPAVVHTPDETPKTRTEQKPTEQKVDGTPPTIGTSALSGLLDQLANKSNLFEPLDRDEAEDAAPETNVAGVKSPPEMDPDVSSAPAPGLSEISGAPEEVQWRVTGEGFVPLPGTGSAERDNIHEDLRRDETSSEESPGLTGGTGSHAPEAEEEEDAEADRVARYNFDELARILGERVGDDHDENAERAPAPPSDQHTPKPQGKTFKLSEELLVLNRLPIGILIFRDQSILFANRALADIMGSTSISQLRDGGLEGIFPQVSDNAAALGPVANLMDMDGKEVPVTARLQTIVWQGASALMLSAQKREGGGSDGEVSVASFVRAQAVAQDQGYFEADETGTLNYVSPAMAQLLGQPEGEIMGQALTGLIAAEGQALLKEFLVQPAKFAETVRPNLKISGANPDLELSIFTLGRAGVVKGYFGTLGVRSPAGEQGGEKPKRTDIHLLSRISRGIRQPLNSIIGFSEMVLSETFGKQENQRYAEYARDVKNAGVEISRLTEEIDEYVRLENRDTTPESAELDLVGLLDECLRLVRRQASRRQVFVRSAISQNLSNISADRATMRQAILNLLASAIDQTPAGGKVILSAQTEPDGAIDVHVRNSDTQSSEIGDRFVVFRESNARRGEALVPLKSSMGLTLTRSLLAANSCSLSINPSGGVGTLMTLVIPAERTSGSGRS